MMHPHPRDFDCSGAISFLRRPYFFYIAGARFYIGVISILQATFLLLILIVRFLFSVFLYIAGQNHTIFTQLSVFPRGKITLSHKYPTIRYCRPVLLRCKNS